MAGNILQDLGPKSKAASDSLANSGEITFSFEVLWERHSYRHFSPVLFAFLIYLGSGQVLEGILIAKAATSALANPISHLILPLRTTASISYLQVSADPYQIWPCALGW